MFDAVVGNGIVTRTTIRRYSSCFEVTWEVFLDGRAKRGWDGLVRNKFVTGYTANTLAEALYRAGIHPEHNRDILPEGSALSKTKLVEAARKNPLRSTREKACTTHM